LISPLFFFFSPHGRLFVGAVTFFSFPFLRKRNKREGCAPLFFILEFQCGAGSQDALMPPSGAEISGVWSELFPFFPFFFFFLRKVEHAMSFFLFFFSDDCRPTLCPGPSPPPFSFFSPFSRSIGLRQSRLCPFFFLACKSTTGVPFFFFFFFVV